MTRTLYQTDYTSTGTISHAKTQHSDRAPARTLFDLPTDEASLLQHYTLADDDIEHVRERRRPENQDGVCASALRLAHPGRLLKPGEVIPETVSHFIAAQLGLKPEDLLPYAAREETRHEHLAALRNLYGYGMFTGKRAGQMKSWLDERLKRRSQTRRSHDASWKSAAAGRSSCPESR